MPWSLPTNWQPTQLIAVGHSANTSTGATEVKTDAGQAYIKPMGNRQGPHVLATDWIGTHLAKWFGLATFDIALLTLTADDTFDLPRGAKAEPGPAFAAKAMKGQPWGRSSQELDLLVNPKDITRMVIFDTWTLNCDRYFYDISIRKPNYDNVFLSLESGINSRYRLIAMDHGLCFIRSGESLTAKLGNIDKVQDEHIYGLFPEFRDRIDDSTISECTARLKEMDRGTAEAMIQTVPVEWDVPDSVLKAWADLIVRRAAFVADNFRKWLGEGN